MEELSERLARERQIYRHEMALMEAAQKRSKSAAGEAAEKTEKKGSKEEEEKLGRQLEEVESELSRLVAQEKDLEKEESAILERRIQEIDRVIPKIQSQALSQDILTERQRSEERLSQIQSRQSFLSRERERFQIQDSAPSSPS